MYYNDSTIINLRELKSNIFRKDKEKSYIILRGTSV